MRESNRENPETPVEDLKTELNCWPGGKSITDKSINSDARCVSAGFFRR
jgi:hypothetical protein